MEAVSPKRGNTPPGGRLRGNLRDPESLYGPTSVQAAGERRQERRRRRLTIIEGLGIGLGIRAPQAGHRVAFATAEWVARLAEAHHASRLHEELRRLVRVPLLIVDEVGYIPFEPDAANLFFQLVSSRYERASLIVTSNKAFGRWVRSSATTWWPPR